ncbi:MAG: 2-amino-4-hydroxy-6-hydroxymethyldihydropteridine diphosphokinase [Paludibacteraceae bacterium]|nr:2-amino-4-hydroxy-6-hydroxymethyldihydropteridine diphosphokinase [Paludibacteraceae bacterium]
MDSKGMHTYRLCMGSNAKEGRILIKKAIKTLNGSFDVEAVTSTIHTPSLDDSSCLFYFNAGISLKTELSPEDLKKHLKKMESDFGRVKGIELVTLDIDIIMMDGNVLHADYKKQYVKYLMNQLSSKLHHLGR